MLRLTHNDLQLTHHKIDWLNPHLLTTLQRDRLRLVQLSDLHFYEMTDRSFYDRVLDHLTELKPDLLFLTGDLIHYGPGYLGLAKEYFQKMQSLCPTVAILGNHDYKDGSASHGVRQMLKEAGVLLLVNEAYHHQQAPVKDLGLNLSPDDASQDISQDSPRLWLLGLDDLWHGTVDFDKALNPIAEAKETDAVLCLAHNPRLFPKLLWEWQQREIKPKLGLMFSGHTHAGHVYLPWLGSFYRWVFHIVFRYGLFEQHGHRLYVSSGLGSAACYIPKLFNGIAFPRFRYNTYPEIVVFDWEK